MMLTQEVLKEAFEYDPEGYLVWKANPAKPKDWNSRFASKRAGGRMSLGYVTIGFNGVRYLAHRLIFLFFHGWLPEEVDHIGHTDRADNRIENLRAATSATNKLNRGRQANNTSGFKGVFWHAGARKWRARIKPNGMKSVHLGLFDTAIDAHNAYAAAAQHFHGSFARTN